MSFMAQSGEMVVSRRVRTLAGDVVVVVLFAEGQPKAKTTITNNKAPKITFLNIYPTSQVNPYIITYIKYAG